MREKEIARNLVIAVIIIAIIIGITIWFTVIRKANKNDTNNNIENNVTVSNNTNTNAPFTPEARKIVKTYENYIYIVDLYSDGTAMAKIKSYTIF